MAKQKNVCDECGSILEKNFILTTFDVPVVGWACPKSECYQTYKREFEKKYHGATND